MAEEFYLVPKYDKSPKQKPRFDSPFKPAAVSNFDFLNRSQVKPQPKQYLTPTIPTKLKRKPVVHI